MRVLIGEQAQQLATGRAEQLLIDGHEPATALTIRAVRLKLAELPDALLLGSLGGISDTIALLRDLRAGAIHRTDNTVPVVVVGADTDVDRIRYYRAGADALLASDSSPLLIAAALEALHRRTGPPALRLLKVASLIVDVDARAARVEDRDLSLTRLEFDLLQTLASHPGKAFTRAELTREVWGYDPAAAGTSRTIDSTASRLRKKLEEAGGDQLLHGIRGVGWRLTR
jgi:two-component system, OmpR family, response regulator PrrA